MQLKYLKGQFINLYLGEGGKAYPLSPIGEIPDKFVKHILKNYPKDFEVYNPVVEIKEETPVEVVQEEKFKCDQCDYEATSNAGLSAHKRFKHKENK